MFLSTIACNFVNDDVLETLAENNHKTLTTLFLDSCTNISDEGVVKVGTYLWYYSSTLTRYFFNFWQLVTSCPMLGNLSLPAIDRITSVSYTAIADHAMHLHTLDLTGNCYKYVCWDLFYCTWMDVLRVCYNGNNDAILKYR